MKSTMFLVVGTVLWLFGGPALITGLVSGDLVVASVGVVLSGAALAADVLWIFRRSSQAGKK